MRGNFFHRRPRMLTRDLFAVANFLVNNYRAVAKFHTLVAHILSCRLEGFIAILTEMTILCCYHGGHAENATKANAGK